MKSGNRESFTFAVESDLKPKIRGAFKKQNSKEILNEIQKEEKEHTILAGIFDDNDEGFNYQFEGNYKLIAGYISAYKNHFPMTLTPDTIWLLIIQSFSTHMEKNSEKLRKYFVNFEGKKELKVETEKNTLEIDAVEWGELIEKMTGKIEENIGEKMMKILNPEFTTSTQVSSICSKIGVMGSMKQYFKYVFDGQGCGVSAMTVEGSVEDWEKIKNNVEFLGNLDDMLKNWTEIILPILEKIIFTVKTKNADVQFWKDFIRIKDAEDDVYDSDRADGWITKFILYDKYKKIRSPEYDFDDGIEFDDMPDEILPVPIKIIEHRVKKAFEGKIEYGFYGFKQDKKTFNVKPVLGYVIFRNNKKIENTAKYFTKY